MKLGMWAEKIGILDENRRVLGGGDQCQMWYR